MASKQAPYHSTSLSILYGLCSIAQSGCSQWETLKKVEGCRKCDISETTLPISMKLIGYYDVLGFFNVKFEPSLCMRKDQI